MIHLKCKFYADRFFSPRRPSWHQPPPAVFFFVPLLTVKLSASKYSNKKSAVKFDKT